MKGKNNGPFLVSTTRSREEWEWYRREVVSEEEGESRQLPASFGEERKKELPAVFLSKTESRGGAT